MATLTSRTLAQSTAITPTTLIHIVTTGDTSQSASGSSFKAELQQLTTIFGGYPSFTGGTVSGSTTFTSGLTANTISTTNLTLNTSFTPSGTTDTNGNPGSVAWDDDNFYYKTNNGWFIVTGNTF